MSEPSSWTPRRLAFELSKNAKMQITQEMIEKDVASGAPVRHDGTINLVQYVAWLVKQEAINAAPTP